jgi:hypothetical protein
MMVLTALKQVATAATNAVHSATSGSGHSHHHHNATATTSGRLAIFNLPRFVVIGAGAHEAFRGSFY